MNSTYNKFKDIEHFKHSIFKIFLIFNTIMLSKQRILIDSTTNEYLF